MYQSPFGPSAQATAPSATSASNGPEKISGTIKKEIIDILKESGIQSDVDAFLNKANSFLNNSISLSSKSLFGGTDDDYSMSDLITIQQMANSVKFNKTKWDSAVKNLDEQNAWGDIAIDSRGYMYVSDSEGNVTAVDPSKFDPSKQQALTNEQMLGLRERSSQFAMNSGLLNNISKAVGMESVQKYLRELVEKLGTTNVQGYGSKEQTQIINGIKELMEAGPDGYYKITNKQQAGDINAALKYLHGQLTSPMRQTLEATIAAEGGDPYKDKYKFIGSILTQNIDVEQKADFDQSATKSAGLDSESKASIKDTLAEKYASGSGAPPPKREVLMSSTSGVPMYAYTQDLGAIMNNTGKSALGNANLQDVLTNGYGISTDTDRKSVTFGDMLIDSADLSKIVYDSTTNLQRVYLPARTEGGRITPDFKLYETINELNNNLTKSGYTSGQIKSVLEENYPNLTYDEQSGLIVAKNTQLFYTFGAIASTDTFGSELRDSKWLVEQSDETDRNWKNEYNRLTGYRFNSSSKKADATGNSPTKNGIMPWNWGYKFFKGNVFIAVTEPMLASTIHNDQYWSKDVYTNMTQKAEAAERAQMREQMSNLKTNF